MSRWYIIYKYKSDNRLATHTETANSAKEALDQWLEKKKITNLEPMFVHAEMPMLTSISARAVYRVEKINEPKYKLFG